MKAPILVCIAAVLAGGGFLVAAERVSGPPARSGGVQSGTALAGELGCSVCHTDLGGTTIRERAPSLSAAGVRYRASYLYDYLLAPRRVRPHIGAARMPDFHLDERESLALTLYLTTLSAEAPAPPVESGASNGEALIRNELGCLVCHGLDGSGGASAPSLDSVGARVTEDFLVRYLAAPTAFDTTNVMPPLFYDRTGNAWRPRVADAAQKLGAVTQYLLGRGGNARDAAHDRFEDARSAHADVTPEHGEEMARALGCGGCHRGLPVPEGPVGPPLRTASSRVRPEWLRSFLQAPTPVRPAGYHPGSGSRMPDFRLTEAEVAALAGMLQREPPSASPSPTLTPFQRGKAEAFLVDRLPCLGCHRLNGDGGRIGPDLSGVGSRLTREAIRNTIAHPQQAAPGSIMPRHPMPADRIDLLTAFLATQTTPDSSAYVSVVDMRPEPRDPDAQSGEGIYRTYCAHCHGVAGTGDGWNAPFLPAPPTRHADSTYMSTRPDDTLYDGVHAGGYILNRSHRMPAFGQRLSDRQIRAVVDYMRELCNCQGPAWSRDGRGNRGQ
jgi:mono/diheme cytochrome c family protein